MRASQNKGKFRNLTSKKQIEIKIKIHSEMALIRNR